MKNLIVTGWEKSKAASNEDGGVSDIIAFLERRGTMSMAKWATSKGMTSRAPIKIRKVSFVWLPYTEVLKSLYFGFRGLTSGDA